ncbi:uncharacterized protein LOC123659284 [Melitaea cinxia]|uniref:uncharacterized protein LOC123659284 n=1 Tax=Melitaea cinxia TaxID=113334 RepID=UPI001E274BE5|nr:uncharacterized protein LOC123659284 [Melitaea cinxia]
MEDHRLEELEYALKSINWDIIGLCEVRRSGEEIREYNEYIFYYNGETQGIILNFKGISDRIVVLNMQLAAFKQPISIIQTYAPTEQDTIIVKEKFYKKLAGVLQGINKNVIVMGDFNAKTGSKSNKDEFVLGKYSSGERNDNGQRLIDFCFTFNLKIMNSFFKKGKMRKWTWISPNGKHMNEIDFILSREKQIFRDVSVVNIFNFNTDHRMVRGIIKCKKRNSRKHILSNKNIGTSFPLSKTNLDELNKTLLEIKTHRTLQEKYDFLEKAMKEVNRLRTKIEKRDKLGEETKKLMEERKKLLENRKDNFQNIANISKKIQISIRRHRKEERLNILKNKNILIREKRFELEEEIPCILEAEVVKAIQTQKSGKAPGDDKISNELLKDTITTIVKPLTYLFNEILFTEQIPTQWTKSTIILLPKKGDKTNINNYRPICLTSNIYKVFSKVILGRITKQLDANQPKEQIQLERVGDEFTIERGVRQGDPLSPKIFTAVLENIFRNIEWEHFGINVNGTNLNHLRFADDIVLFADTPEMLQTMIYQLDQESRKAGLSMNPIKTKLMTNAIKHNIELRQEPIEYVDEYVYLGQIISTKDQYSKEMDRRISNTWKRYWSLKEIFKNETIPMTVKSKLYNICILPCLTYGCQTWPATYKNNEKLVSCQRHMERSMLDIKLRDRWTIAKIRSKTKVSDISKTIKKLKWNWIGHIMRTNKEKWTKNIMEWYPRNGKRQRGRPIKRWDDDLPKGWRRLARERKVWEQLGEAYVEGQPDKRTGY